MNQPGPTTRGVLAGRRSPAIARAGSELRLTGGAELPDGPVADAARRAADLAARYRADRAQLSRLLEDAKRAVVHDRDSAARAIVDDAPAPKPTASRIYEQGERHAEQLRTLERAVEIAVAEFDRALAADDGRVLEHVQAERRAAVEQAQAALEQAGERVEQARSWDLPVRVLGGGSQGRLDDVLAELAGVRRLLADKLEPSRIMISDLSSRRVGDALSRDRIERAAG